MEIGRKSWKGCRSQVTEGSTYLPEFSVPWTWFLYLSVPRHGRIWILYKPLAKEQRPGLRQAAKVGMRSTELKLMDNSRDGEGTNSGNI